MRRADTGPLFALSGAAAARSPAAVALTARVRGLLAEWRDQGVFEPAVDGWLTGFSPEMSARLGEAGLIGTALPREYGGQSGSALDRLIVTEELLVAGAPVAAHWFAERQVAPALVRHGTEEQRARHIPEIVAGRSFFSIGMSEPDAGSDLSAVATRATRTRQGWRITGTKIWTSQADRSHYLLLLGRSRCENGDSRSGLTQFIVPLDAPGVTISPIGTMDGGAHFAEVHLDEVELTDEDILGNEGSGWAQVMEELVYERTGAERMLSTFPLLLEAHRTLRGWHEPQPAQVLGRLLTDAFVLRETVASAVMAIAQGEPSGPATAMVKDVATRYEQRLISDLRAVSGLLQPHGSTSQLERLSRHAVLSGPAMTLRGGANEVLRTIVAKELVRGATGLSAVGSGR